jgi:CRP-like cAMP-binding protein
MSPEQLRSFQPFVRAAPALLSWAAARSSLLQLPPMHWLVRPGRPVRGCYYLLRGRVRLLDDAVLEQVLTPRSSRCRWPLHPGAAAVQTLTPTRLLRLDLEAATLEAVAVSVRRPVPGAPGPLAEHPGRAGLPEVDGQPVGWEHAFLASPLMQRLPLSAWQRLLRATRPVPAAAGERLLGEGEPGDRCYVLTAGRAEVRQRGRRLSVLNPGDFFGEEALITGAARNATVVMVETGAVRSLDADPFRHLLLNAVVRPAETAGRRRLLHVGAEPPPGTLAFPAHRVRELGPGLEPAFSYAVQGGSAAERALVVFLLARLGLDAVALRC